MGISVFMFCPECRVFMPLGHRDPMLECDVNGEENWGEGGFWATSQDVLQVFLGQEDFFSPSNAYEVALRRLVQQFVANHADHDEDRTPTPVLRACVCVRCVCACACVRAYACADLWREQARCTSRTTTAITCGSRGRGICNQAGGNMRSLSYWTSSCPTR
jgi:hypothetical protein